jgi:hypothetical protein
VPSTEHRREPDKSRRGTFKGNYREGELQRRETFKGTTEKETVDGGSRLVVRQENKCETRKETHQKERVGRSHLISLGVMGSSQL